MRSFSAWGCLCSVVFFLLLTVPTYGRVEHRVSYEDEFELDLKAFKAKNGCDVWLSKDQGDSWVLIGKTFGEEQRFSYHAQQAGLHYFHINPRGDDNEIHYPGVDAEVHAAIDLKKVERENVDILYSNRRVLSISYEVQDISHSTSGHQFDSWLYYTTSSGLNWSLYGPDEEQGSPVSFVARSDGLYGFKVVSVDISGQREDAPVAGTTPDVLVRIDTVAPEVELLSPQPYDLWSEGTLRTIRWNVKDDAMDEVGAVSLYYACGEQRDWLLLREGLPRAGELEWRVPFSENGKVFIQARAKDISGNLGLSADRPPFFTRNILEEMLSQDIREKAEGYFATATICRKNNDQRKALKYYGLCLQLNPYHVRAFNDTGICMLTLGLWKEAFAKFESGLKYAPSDEHIMANLSRLYMDHLQFGDAERILRRMVALYPKSADGLWLLSELYFGLGAVEKARFIWQRLSHLDFDEESRGLRYQFLAEQRLDETLISVNKKKTSYFWMSK